MSGQDFPIFPEDLFTPLRDDSDQCVLEVQASSEALPVILGDTFLRTVGTVFDVGQLRVGLARRADVVPRLESTRERLRADADAIAGGRSAGRLPLLPPHRPGSESLSPQTVLLALSAGALAGWMGGHLATRIYDLCHPADDPRGGATARAASARCCDTGPGGAYARFV
mmetsp:Transcript_56062/g.181755  ORF Transcript_56062/g.181755 Transcript_56062/m.181755 type:complete len:169 (-) Transcript_56062:126-632(-)